jgi:LacI family transcriptional regulator
VTTNQNDPRTELESVSVLTSHRVDGLIIAPANSGSRELRDALVRAGVPVVAIDRPISHSSIPSVVADNFAGTHSATLHLIEHGYKRIACMTGEANLYTIRKRISGYRRAVEAHGLPVILDTSITKYRSAEDAIRRMLAGPDRPDAILTLKNSVTMYAFAALQKLHVSIPDTVALLGKGTTNLPPVYPPTLAPVHAATFAAIMKMICLSNNSRPK